MINKNCKSPIKKYRIHVKENLNKRKVVNISGIKLSQSETSILSKGLNFCPNPTEMKKSEVYRNIDDFKRNISLKVLFREAKNDYTPTILDKIVKTQNRNPFQPPLENCVEAYADALKFEIEKSKKHGIKSNVTKRENEALKRLSERSDIVIRRADKGGATVICSKDWYEKESYKQLNDLNFYKEVSEDDTKQHEIVIKDKLEELKEAKLIESKLVKQLVPSESRTSEFYLLPKIHKKGIPGRPVISSSGCATEKISAFVDQHLKPAAQKLPSYIKDTEDFIGKMRKLGKVGTNDYLVTLDVSSLYTNINNTEGIEAIKSNKTLKETLKAPIINMISDLMLLVLTLNNFIFNGQHFHQIKGTAMGTRAAPNYANLFMGSFEDKFIYKSDYMKYISFFGRFIDDICLIWKGSESQLKEFLHHLNTVHPSIKFTSEYSLTEVNFLDVILRKDIKGYLSTDVYQKDTDTHNYLQRDSAHPEHSKKSIPYSQFLRLKRIVSDQKTLKERIREYIEYFVNSGYKRKALMKTANQVLRNEPINDAKMQDKNTVRFITTYNRTLPDIKSLVHKHWSMLGTNSKCEQVFSMKPQIVYKRNKNLTDTLVRAKYRSGEINQANRNTIKEVTKCLSCSWCSKLKEGSIFRSNTTGKEYKIYHEMTCTTPWVIYLCKCKKHNKQYVGKSKTKLNIRMNNNRNHLRIGKGDCKLVQHFIDSTTCEFEKDLEIMPIEKIMMPALTENDMEKKQTILKEREIFWQQTLKTFEPNGFNKRQG